MDLAFTAAGDPAARPVLEDLRARYGEVPVERAEIIVVVGGNGTVVRALHRYHRLGRPFFPMTPGYTGFLTNPFRCEDLPERIVSARAAVLSPFDVRWTGIDGREGTALAFNEVSLFRQTRQMAHIRIAVHGGVRMHRLIGDGVLVATPAGSTAYNQSAHGPILPMESGLLALTPVAPFRPRRWRGALLSDRSTVRFGVLRPDERPTSLTADFVEHRYVAGAVIRLCEERKAALLFDADSSFNERILVEQFKA